jgi:hypothetical protein
MLRERISNLDWLMHFWFYQYIYPEGSKDGYKEGSAVFNSYFTSRMRIHNKAHIFTAKVKVI